MVGYRYVVCHLQRPERNLLFHIHSVLTKVSRQLLFSIKAVMPVFRRAQIVQINAN